MRRRGEGRTTIMVVLPVKTYKSLQALATNHLDRILDVPVET